MSDLRPADIQELIRYIRKKTKRDLGMYGILMI